MTAPQHFCQSVRMPVPIIGLALVFAGGKDKRQPWEFPVISLTSWLSAVIGILYLLMIPWSGFTTLRLYRQANQEVADAIAQQQAQIAEVRSSLETVNSDEDLARLLSRVINQTIFVDDLNASTDSVKDQLRTSLDQGEANIQTQAQTTLNQRRLRLFKNSIKWNLGALVSAVILILIWQSTAWARSAT